MMQMAQLLMSDPETARLMQNQDVMQKLMALMQNPQEGMINAMNDPDMMKIITKIQSLMGGSGMGSGMGGDTGATGFRGQGGASQH